MHEIVDHLQFWTNVGMLIGVELDAHQQQADDLKIMIVEWELAHCWFGNPKYPAHCWGGQTRSALKFDCRFLHSYYETKHKMKTAIEKKKSNILTSVEENHRKYQVQGLLLKGRELFFFSRNGWIGPVQGNTAKNIRRLCSSTWVSESDSDWNSGDSSSSHS